MRFFFFLLNIELDLILSPRKKPKRSHPSSPGSEKPVNFDLQNGKPNVCSKNSWEIYENC